MANDVADYTSSVVVQSGSVVISAGTAVIGSVNIGNSPTVILGAGTASIGSVSVSAGTVTIANANIAVINAAGTKITSSRPPAGQASVAIATSGTRTDITGSLPLDIQAIVLVLDWPLANYAHLKVEWNITAVPPQVENWIPFELFSFAQQIYVFPITPSINDGNQGTAVNTLKVTLQASAAGIAAYQLIYLFESSPEWLTLFPQPQLEPNQVPRHNELGLAAGAAKWIIAPVANVQITAFDILLNYFTNGAAGDQWYIAHAPILPAAGAFPTLAQILVSGGTSGIWPFNYPLGASQLPRGEGIFAEVTLSAAANMGVTIVNSLS